MLQAGGRAGIHAEAAADEFPVIDGSYVQQFVPIRRCGIEDLSIEQTENPWITASQFTNAWDCWAR